MMAATGGAHAAKNTGIWPFSPRICAKLRMKYKPNPNKTAESTAMPVPPDRVCRMVNALATRTIAIRNSGRANSVCSQTLWRRGEKPACSSWRIKAGSL